MFTFFFVCSKLQFLLLAKRNVRRLKEFFFLHRSKSLRVFLVRWRVMHFFERRAERHSEDWRLLIKVDHSWPPKTIEVEIPFRIAESNANLRRQEKAKKRFVECAKKKRRIAPTVQSLWPYVHVILVWGLLSFFGNLQGTFGSLKISKYLQGF